MRTKLLYSGDYAREFGGKKPRIWRTFGVYLNGKDIGRIEQEPDDYITKFRSYNTPFVFN